MTRHHELTRTELAAVATGLGGAAVVGELMASRLSRHLLLLKYLAGEWREDRRLLDAAVGTLAEAQHRSPAVFRRLLSDPLVGTWLAHTTRQLRRHPDDRLTGDLLHLGALAASAAVQTGLDADVVGYARQGRVTLPDLGEAVLADDTDGPVSIKVRQGRALLGSSGTAVPGDSPDWHGVRRLTARHGDLAATVNVEDGNPYRGGYHVAPSDRLSATEAQCWQSLFEQAWHLLGRYLPARAAEVGAGLRTMVPLRDRDPGAARSGTARDSVGALGLTTPRSPEDFVITIVHEFQHSKLSAVLDVVDLYVRDGAELHFAPWRTDPRPTAGLVQGVYAFLGIAGTWRDLRAAPALHDLATDQYALAREQVRAGLAALEGSAELTVVGREFTGGMRRALDAMLGERLPAPHVASARDAVARLRGSWELRQIGRATTAQ